MAVSLPLHEGSWPRYLSPCVRADDLGFGGGNFSGGYGGGGGGDADAPHDDGFARLPSRDHLPSGPVRVR